MKSDSNESGGCFITLTLLDSVRKLCEMVMNK